MAIVQNSLLYSSTHEWIKAEGDICVIGITDFAQSQLGDIVYIELPEAGENVFTNNVFGSIESVKTVSELISDENKRKNIQLSNYVDDKVGMLTLKDISSELEKPGRDPRTRGTTGCRRRPSASFPCRLRRSGDRPRGRCHRRTV